MKGANRLTRLALSLGLGFTLLTVALVPTFMQASPAAAQGGPQWTLDELTSFGCQPGDLQFFITFSGLNPSDLYYVDTIVRGPAGIYMDEYLGPYDGNSSTLDSDWGIYDQNSRGLQSAFFPLPADTVLTITVTLRDANEDVLSEHTSTFVCNTGEFTRGPVAGASGGAPLDETL